MLLLDILVWSNVPTVSFPYHVQLFQCLSVLQVENTHLGLRWILVLVVNIGLIQSVQCNFSASAKYLP